MSGSGPLTFDPLDPTDPTEKRYVPLADAGRAAVDELLETIETAFDPTTQLLFGPSGAGKTTELYRLRGELTKAGYLVSVVDVSRYVNNAGRSM